MSKNRWFGNLTKKNGIDLWYNQKSRRIIDKAKRDFNYEVGWKIEPVQQELDGFINLAEGEETPFT